MLSEAPEPACSGRNLATSKPVISCTWTKRDYVNNINNILPIVLIIMVSKTGNRTTITSARTKGRTWVIDELSPPTSRAAPLSAARGRQHYIRTEMISDHFG